MDILKIIALKTAAFEMKEMLFVESSNLRDDLNRAYRCDHKNVDVYREKLDATNDLHGLISDFIAQIDRYQSRLLNRLD